MGDVVLDISMSLDGFIAGPNDAVEPLHDWIFSGETASSQNELFKPAGNSREVLDEAIEATGAIVAGRGTYDAVDGWGGDPPIPVPYFILSHRAPEDAGETFTFVTDGIESAVERAEIAAGDKNVGVMGANTAQQCIQAGLLDEIELHLVPVLLGEGIRLFEHLGTEQIDLEPTRIIESPGVTHLRFRVVK